jgi:hypothetical protein
VNDESRYCCGDAQRYLETAHLEGARRWRFKLRYWVSDSFACPELFYCPFCGTRLREHEGTRSVDMAPVGLITGVFHK